MVKRQEIPIFTTLARITSLNLARSHHSRHYPGLIHKTDKQMKYYWFVEEKIVGRFHDVLIFSAAFSVV
jgi:hypothetical protein